LAHDSYGTDSFGAEGWGSDWGDPDRAGPVGTTVAPAAAVHDVHKTYLIADERIEALKGIDKEFPAGRVSTIVGPSGSGKSSLLRILACVDRPTTGSVQVGGQEIAGLSVRKRRALRRTAVGYVFQNPVDNLVEYLRAAEQVRLTGRADHLPVQLSGGEQQRLSFACAVIGRPAIVVADEPTAELDSASADRVLEAVHDLRDEGVAFLLSSHDPRVVQSTDHLLRLEHGEVVESW
jgi:putative ABC transport system ATP-binding protein